MKKSFLLSAMLIGASAFCANAQEVIFDFANSAEIGEFSYSPLSLSELRTSTYINSKDEEKAREYASSNNYVLILEGETVSKDGVGITLSNPDKYKDYPRFFFGLIQTPKPENPTAEHYYCDMRWYQKEEIVITAPEGKKLDKVVMNATSGSYPKRANGNTMVVGEVGTQTINDDKTLNTWEAGDAVVTSLTYKATADSPTQMAYSVAVTISDNSESAVAEISADENATAVYFDLTGAKHNAENLAPGVYVKRQGSKTTKVLVK